MTKRVAFFSGKSEIEQFFGIHTKRQNLFEPHYNLTPGQHIPIIIPGKDGKEISRVRWGEDPFSDEHSIQIAADSTEEELSQTKSRRCVIPLSGFYVWKDNRQKDHPFFVRMLNNPVMAVAGIYYPDNDGYFKIVMTESNALIHPMSETMPLLFNQEFSNLWLNAEEETSTLLEESKNLFFLTDISVMRVDKKVNDPTLNDPTLVQPIPK